MTNDNDRDEPVYPSDNPDYVRGLNREGELVSFSPLEQLDAIHKSVAEAIESAQQRGEEERITLTEQESILVLEYFTVASAQIESQSVSLLYKRLVPGKKKESPFAPYNTFFAEELNQKQREGLLFTCGIIDSGLKGEMSKTRQVRNNLVHKPYEKYTIESEGTIQADIDRALRAVKRLLEMQ